MYNRFKMRPQQENGKKVEKSTNMRKVWTVRLREYLKFLPAQEKMCGDGSLEISASCGTSSRRCFVSPRRAAERVTQPTGERGSDITVQREDKPAGFEWKRLEEHDLRHSAWVLSASSKDRRKNPSEPDA